MSNENGILWPEDKPVPLDSPLIPPSILQAVNGVLQPGDALFRVPGATAVEWWLIDADGNLVDSFWLEQSK